MTTDTLEALSEARAALSACVPDYESMNRHVTALTIRTTLSRIDAALAPDHIGNSTTKVPALGVEGVAQIVRKAIMRSSQSHALPFPERSATYTEDAQWAARAIIAAMEKNDG